jgi:POT family proton-dependent oligopeptide transporter
MSQNTTDEFFKTLFLDTCRIVRIVLLKCGNDFLIMECVLYLFCFNIVPCKAGHGVLRMHGFVWNLYYVCLFHSCNWRILGGRYLGYRWAVVLGALAMTLGHASMAVETPLFFIYWWVSYYRNGLFKPNMTSII